jgi:hypothetical protein
MAKLTEVEAIKAIDDALAGLEEDAARERVLTWAWGKFSSRQLPSANVSPPHDGSHSSSTEHTGLRQARRRGKSSAKRASVRLKTAALSMAKDLNLRPNGKQSFQEFASAKKPTSQQERCVVAVSYLKDSLSLPAISASHVYTCFKHMNWRVPTDLKNKLAFTASHHGWLDTSNMESIQITPMGENLIAHDLPRKKKTK